MSRQQTPPLPPRIGAPDLPSRLDDTAAHRYADLRRSRLAGLSGAVDLEHASLEECLLPSPSVETLALRGATLVDVEITDIRAVSVSARDTTVRRLRIAGGRIGTLDLTGARVSELELRDLRIDYLTFAGARAEDVLVGDSAVGTLDLPQAQLTRVAFQGSRADEVDPRGMRASDVDLRGLDALAYLDVLALRGATLSEEQVRALAPAFAAASGIHVRD